MANEPTDFFKMALNSWRYARAGEFGEKAYDLIEAHVVAGGEVRAVALMLPAALAASMTHCSPQNATWDYKPTFGAFKERISGESLRPRICPFAWIAACSPAEALIASSAPGQWPRRRLTGKRCVSLLSKAKKPPRSPWRFLQGTEGRVPDSGAASSKW